MAYIELKNLTKKFKGNVLPSVDNACINIEKGQIATLLGPSGCGKTTILRMIAGFEKPDVGSISIGGNVVVDETTWLSPEKRGVGMVFQDYALFPHLTIEQNIGFGIPKDKVWKNRVADTLDIIGLCNCAKRYPSELSGGQQQRVALARALIRNPVAVLLDEPFSNLDTELRLCMREEVIKILKQSNITSIFVTHDQKEALALSDTIIVMKDGNIEQTGTPIEIYQEPATRFVANFVGQSNIISGVLNFKENNVCTNIGPIPFCYNKKELQGDVLVSVRPDGFILKKDGAIEGKVIYTEYSGNFIFAIIETVGKDGGVHKLFVHICSMYPISVGDEIGLEVIPHFVSLINHE